VDHGNIPQKTETRKPGNPGKYLPHENIGCCVAAARGGGGRERELSRRGRVG